MTVEGNIIERPGFCGVYANGPALPSSHFGMGRSSNGFDSAEASCETVMLSRSGRVVRLANHLKVSMSSDVNKFHTIANK